MGQVFGCIQVNQSTVAIKERFGKFDSVLEPGCYCYPWCLGYQSRGRISLRVQLLDLRCETKTKDNVFVHVVASVQYRALADKASDVFYKLPDTKKHIQSYVCDEIRSIVSQLDWDAAFVQKKDIARAVKEKLENAMSQYGYEIVETLIVDIELDVHFKEALKEIYAAARMRMETKEKAELERIVQIKLAEVESESKYLSGLGIARHRRAIVDGLRDSMPGASAKELMDMVLATHYFDTMKEIGASSKSSSLFIPHGPGVVSDITSQICEGFLQANSVQHFIDATDAA